MSEPIIALDQVPHLVNAPEAEDRPTLARVPRMKMWCNVTHGHGLTNAPDDGPLIEWCHYEKLEAAYDALAQQLQQAQAACDRWALNYNMAQADLARARGSYEADVLRLTGERDEAREQLQPMTADRDYWKARAPQMVKQG